MELLGKMLEHPFRLNDMSIGVNHAHCVFLLSFILDWGVSLFVAQNFCQAIFSRRLALLDAESP